MNNDYLNNIACLSDSYKFDHYRQYPPKSQFVYAYFESRDGAEWDHTAFFGLQYILKKYFTGKVVTKEKIDYAEKRINLHRGPGVFNRTGWEHILHYHNGHLPIVVKAVPEGTRVGQSNLLMSVHNTDPRCYWLPNYLETLLTQVWYPSTVATQSYEMRKIIQAYMDRTSDNPTDIDYKLHDFGFRGVTCVEQAAIGAAAHLLNFRGTDTFPGVEMAYQFYGEEMAGFSIPASEHSTITSWGRENELEAIRNMLEQYPDGLVACVSDSYNIWEACEKLWGTELKDQILHRDGCLVIRPDSGKPEIVLPRLLNILADKFGYTVNSKGYKVLDPHVRLIQGDGVDIHSLSLILSAVEMAGYSADNINFGSGGGLLQKLNRDTQKFAFKASHIIIDGVGREVYKDPITDPGKVSKRGRLKLVRSGNDFVTVAEAAPGKDQLQRVYNFGQLMEETTFADVRHTLWG